jgi:hypothetical protein
MLCRRALRFLLEAPVLLKWRFSSIMLFTKPMSWLTEPLRVTYFRKSPLLLLILMELSSASFLELCRLHRAPMTLAWAIGQWLLLVHLKHKTSNIPRYPLQWQRRVLYHLTKLVLLLVQWCNAINFSVRSWLNITTQLLQKYSRLSTLLMLFKFLQSQLDLYVMRWVNGHIYRLIWPIRILWLIFRNSSGLRLNSHLRAGTVHWATQLIKFIEISHVHWVEQMFWLIPSFNVTCIHILRILTQR